MANDTGGFVDKFVTLLGYKVDDTGLKEFKSGMKSAVKTTKKVSAETKRAGKSSQKSMARGFRQGVRKIKIQLRLAVRAIKKWRRDNEKQIRKVDEAWGKLKKRGQGLLSFFGKLTGAVSLAGGAFFTLLGFTNKATAKMSAMAESVQVNMSFLGAMGSIVEELGFNYENVTDMVEEMNNKMGEASGLPEEMTAVKESLQILGLEFDALEKMKPEDQFVRILEEARKLDNHQQAVSAVDMLMGGESNKVVGLLRSQGQAFDELLFRRMRLDMLNKRGEAGAKAFGKSMQETGLVVSTMKDQFFGLVGEGLSPMLDNLNDWVLANKELIQTKIAEYAERTVEAIEDLAKWIKDTAPKAEELFDSLGGLAGIIRIIKGALVSVIAVKVIGFLISLGEMFVAVKGFVIAALPVIKAFGAAIAGAAVPILIIVAAIAVLVLALQDLYTWFRGGDSVFGEFGESIGDGIWYIKENWEEVLDFIVSHFGVSLDEIKEYWYSTFTQITNFIEFIPEYWMGVFDAFVEWVSAVPGRIAEKLKAGAGAVKDSLLSGLKGIPGIGSLISGASPAANYVPLAPGAGTTTNNSKQSNTSNNNANIVINAPQNTSPREIADSAKNAFREMLAGAASTEGVTG